MSGSRPVPGAWVPYGTSIFRDSQPVCSANCRCVRCEDGRRSAGQRPSVPPVVNRAPAWHQTAAAASNRYYESRYGGNRYARSRCEPPRFDTMHPNGERERVRNRLHREAQAPRMRNVRSLIWAPDDILTKEQRFLRLYLQLPAELKVNILSWMEPFSLFSLAVVMQPIDRTYHANESAILDGVLQRQFAAEAEVFPHESQAHFFDLGVLSWPTRRKDVYLLFLAAMRIITRKIIDHLIVTFLVPPSHRLYYYHAVYSLWPLFNIPKDNIFPLQENWDHFGMLPLTRRSLVKATIKELARVLLLRFPVRFPPETSERVRTEFTALGVSHRAARLMIMKWLQQGMSAIRLANEFRYKGPWKRQATSHLNVNGQGPSTSALHSRPFTLACPSDLPPTLYLVQLAATFPSTSILEVQTHLPLDFWRVSQPCEPPRAPRSRLTHLHLDPRTYIVVFAGHHGNGLITLHLHTWDLWHAMLRATELPNGLPLQWAAFKAVFPWRMTTVPVRRVAYWDWRGWSETLGVREMVEAEERKIETLKRARVAEEQRRKLIAMRHREMAQKRQIAELFQRGGFRKQDRRIVLM